ATSSKSDRTKGALIGATVGGAAGAGYGYYVDQQEARLRQELSGTGVQVIRNGDNLQLVMPGNITFASNSSAVSSNFYPTLNSLVKVFKEYDKNGIEIIGHTDSTGGMDLNMRLSQERAGSVAAYLTGQGVAASRISSSGAGPNQPIASNNTEAGRAQNRRVEINLRPL
ncbi:MAG: OmpA family protein, partial [Pseudomonas sp.]|nr:OmpA family protein [Pseudomonas sp.]